MKKILFLLILLSSTFVGAQTTSNERIALQTMDNPDFEEVFFGFIDMKFLHDRQIMQTAILQLIEQQNNPQTVANGKRDNLTQGIFNEKDSNILETTMDQKKISYNITSELLKKVDEEPFKAFQDLVRSASVPKLTQQELDQLNQVDDKVVSQLFQMVTESGPDVGARPVSVMYDNEI